MQKVSSKNSSPLKGKRVQCPEYLDADCFDYEDLKSAVAGLIKFHEDRIEELIKLIETSEANFEEVNITLNLIKFEYESIMAIEHWLEDVI
jgi:hypothetical protein